MIFEGTLEAGELLPILRSVASQRGSGLLSVQGEPDLVSVTMQDGAIVAADAMNLPAEEVLGEILARRGLLSPSDFETAIVPAMGTGKLASEVLAEAGLIDDDELRDAVREQTRTLVVRLLRWERGNFNWTSDVESPYHEGVEPLALAELLIRSSEDLGPEGPLREIVVAMDQPFRAVADVDRPLKVLGREGEWALDDEDSTWLTPAENEVLARLVQTPTSVDQLVSEGAEVFSIRYAFSELWRLGLIEPATAEELEAPTSSAVPPAPASFDESPVDAPRGFDDLEPSFEEDLELTESLPPAALETPPEALGPEAFAPEADDERPGFEEQPLLRPEAFGLDHAEGSPMEAPATENEPAETPSGEPVEAAAESSEPIESPEPEEDPVFAAADSLVASQPDDSFSESDWRDQLEDRLDPYESMGRAGGRPQRSAPSLQTTSAWLARGSAVALVLLVIWMAFDPGQRGQTFFPYAWQAGRQEALERDQRTALFQKVDAAVRTYFLLYGRYPEELGLLVDLQLLTHGDLYDSRGRWLDYEPMPDGYTLQPLSGSAETMRAELVSDFLLNPQWVELPEPSPNPVVLID